MDRRQYPRVPLDIPFFVEVTIEGGVPFSALLIDIGRGGLQLAFPLHQRRVNELLGCSVTVDGLPVQSEQEEILRNIPGIVSWVSPERFGIRFEDPVSLTEEDLADLAFSL